MTAVEQQIASEAAALQQRWDADPRWARSARPYSAEEVVRLRGRIRHDHAVREGGGERSSGT